MRTDHSKEPRPTGRFEETSESSDVHQSRADVPKGRTRRADAKRRILFLKGFYLQGSYPVASLLI